MELNADLSCPATVDSAALAWVASPMPGVDRRMLERNGNEVARATSLVRYAPGSSFSLHIHGAGEEFLVLDGVFSDETGDFPAGSYVRNPPGSRHQPRSASGAVMFVKLRQMPPEETRAIRLNTRDPTLWHDRDEHRQEALLFEASWERVVMLRLAAGYMGVDEKWPHGVEIFVIEGKIKINGTPCNAGTWLRRPPGSVLAVSRQGGALLYRKGGHLS